MLFFVYFKLSNIDLDLYLVFKLNGADMFSLHTMQTI